MSLMIALPASLLLSALWSAAAPQLPTLPDARGKKTVEKLCSNCHGTAILFGPKRTREAWRKTVDQMAALGVEGADEEFDAVVDYLARNFGKINVNRASAVELRDVLGISLQEAEAIARCREVHGEFKDFEGLKKVPGMDPRKVAERRDRVLFR